MTTTAKIAHSAPILAYLLRGLWRRIDWTSIPATRRRDLPRELASAVLLSVERRLDGVYNVAPDGWIAGERVRALAGAVPRVRLPDSINEVVTNLRWRFQRGPIPPGLRSYTRWPWLVANDRLKEAGWRPTVTNEQAYVEGTEAKWWTMVSPKRRQELSLGTLGVAILVATLWVIRAIRRARARRR